MVLSSLCLGVGHFSSMFRVRRLALISAMEQCASIKLDTKPSILSKSSATPSVHSRTAIHSSSGRDRYLHSFGDTFVDSAVVMLEKPSPFSSQSDKTEASDLRAATSPSPSIPKWINPSPIRNAKRQVAEQSLGSSGLMMESQWSFIRSIRKSRLISAWCMSALMRQAIATQPTAIQAASLPKLENGFDPTPSETTIPSPQAW